MILLLKISLKNHIFFGKKMQKNAIFFKIAIINNIFIHKETIMNYLFTIIEKYFTDNLSDYMKRRKRENENNLFLETIENFMNPYGEALGERNTIFKKNLIRNYAHYIALDNIFMCLGNNSKRSKRLDVIFDIVPNALPQALTSKTVFIPYPWSSGNLTGNTNAFRGVVGNGFVFDKTNVHGFYIVDIDIAFIYNANHSISIGSIMNDIKVETNDIVFKQVFLGDKFFEAEIGSNYIVFDEKEDPILLDWKIATLLKMIQLVYKKDSTD